MTRGASSKFSEIFRSSFFMSIATFSSRILGLVRELAIAQIFGASGWTDAFNIAYRIPNMLRDLFAEGPFQLRSSQYFQNVRITRIKASRPLHYYGRAFFW